jgi:hypothetical protein
MRELAILAIVLALGIGGGIAVLVYQELRPRCIYCRRRRGHCNIFCPGRS